MKERNGNRYNLLFSLLGTSSSSSSPSQSLNLQKYSAASGFTTVSLHLHFLFLLLRRNHLLHHPLHLLPIHRPQNSPNLNHMTSEHVSQTKPSLIALLNPSNTLLC